VIAIRLQEKSDPSALLHLWTPRRYGLTIAFIIRPYYCC